MIQTQQTQTIIITQNGIDTERAIVLLLVFESYKGLYKNTGLSERI